MPSFIFIRYLNVKGVRGVKAPLNSVETFEYLKEVFKGVFKGYKYPMKKTKRFGRVLTPLTPLTLLVFIKISVCKR